MSFADRAPLRDAQFQRSRIDSSNCRSTEHVSPTSNTCVRLFSAALFIMSYLRSSMDYDSREILLFLKVNHHLWVNAIIIDEILRELAKAQVENGVMNIEADDEDDNY